MQEKRDLLGRIVPSGGASGRQLEFLNKEDYLTDREKERINAKRDIKGQIIFTTK